MLDAAFNGGTISGITPYVALTVGGVEVTGGSYARVAASFSAASGGAVSNDAAIPFPSPTADWGEGDGFKIVTASSGGTELYSGTLGVTRNILSGDNAPSWAIGELDVSEA